MGYSPLDGWHVNICGALGCNCIWSSQWLPLQQFDKRVNLVTRCCRHRLRPYLIFICCINKFSLIEVGVGLNSEWKIIGGNTCMKSLSLHMRSVRGSKDPCYYSLHLASEVDSRTNLSRRRGQSRSLVKSTLYWFQSSPRESLASTVVVVGSTSPHALARSKPESNFSLHC